MSETRKVIDGRYIEFPDKRIVFVGRLDPEAVGIGFRNAEGETTKISLSPDAAHALGELLTNPIAGTFTKEPNFPPSAKPQVFRWKAIVTEAEAAKQC